VSALELTAIVVFTRGRAAAVRGTGHGRVFVKGEGKVLVGDMHTCGSTTPGGGAWGGGRKRSAGGGGGPAAQTPSRVSHVPALPDLMNMMLAAVVP